MRKQVYILLFAVALWAASVARADLTAAGATLPPASPNSAAVVSQAAEPIVTVDAGVFGLLSIRSPLTDFVPPADRAATPAYEIRSIPAAPGSTVLCLWALGSIGAWQIARSSRKVHFSALPEWYHADAPDQIGHVTLFDLECRLLPAELVVRAEFPPATPAGDYDVKLFADRLSLVALRQRAPPVRIR